MAKDSTMTQERWAQIESALDELLDLDDPVEREAALTRLAARDQELHRSVAELLSVAQQEERAASSALSGLSPGLVSDFERYLLEQDERRSQGKRIGAYRLIRILGRGGMGVVYLAERADEQYHKQVAIKLIPQGLETPEVQRRFLAERQILADLEHPNIARLLDGGVTDEGYPYLVMDYVDGEPIDEYCERRELPVSKRLELFVTVCRAVQHAHQNMIVHRDLKPSNILVTAEGEVRLLDFGVAKLVDNELVDGAGRTLHQPGTPGFSAPEQLANRAVSTASDVYSLGVILYRLLTSSMPAGRRRGTASESGWPTADAPPTAPSVAVRDRPHREGGRAVAEARARSRRLRGDLDSIVLKALEHEPSMRYPTAQHLADDVRRHLAALPVLATNASGWYRFTRFVRRKKWAMAASVAVIAAVTLSVVAVVWQARRATLEAVRAQRVSELIVGLFTDADPYVGQGRDLSVVELLDRGAERLERDLADQPLLRSELAAVLGRAYMGQGEFDRAAALHQSNVELRVATLGETDERVAWAMTDLGAVRINQGDYEAARPLLESALENFKIRGDDRSQELSRTLMYLGNLEAMTGNYASAADLHRRALAIRRSNDRPDGFSVAIELANLSTAVEQLGDLNQATALLREALAIAERTVGDDHPSTAAIRNNLALRLHARGDYEEAELLYRRALSLQRQKLGPEHPHVADAALNLGKLLIDRGDFSAARPFVESAVDISRSHLEPEHVARIAAEMNLATLWREAGDFEAAEALYLSGFDRLTEMVGAADPAVARALSLLAINDRAWGRLERARERFESAIEIQRLATHRRLHLAETLVGLGAVLGDLGELDAAESMLREAVEIYRDAVPATSWQLAESRTELGRVLARQGRTGAAEGLLRGGLEGFAGVFAADDWRRLRAAAVLAEIEGSDAAG